MNGLINSMTRPPKQLTNVWLCRRPSWKRCKPKVGTWTSVLHSSVCIEQESCQPTRHGSMSSMLNSRPTPRVRPYFVRGGNCVEYVFPERIFVLHSGKTTVTGQLPCSARRDKKGLLLWLSHADSQRTTRERRSMREGSGQHPQDAPSPCDVVSPQRLHKCISLH